MIRDKRYPLLAKAEQGRVYQSVTANEADWTYLNFIGQTLKNGESWSFETGNNECAIVLLGGVCSVTSNKGEWKNIGRRPNVFSGMPYALYLSRNTQFTVTAESDELDFACGWCPADKDFEPKLVTPKDSPIEIRGGGNATRQINGILPPGFPAQRLVVVEVYTPAGNWSSYPGHKHDVHREGQDGKVLEADLEEIYFYKMEKSTGFAIQRVYNDDLSLNEVAIAENNDIVLIPEGYHPVAAAPGYNVYYLNFLAGSAQSLANIDDQKHTWLQQEWPEKDPRVPMVTMEMENKNKYK